MDGDAQRDILKMLAENVITVDDAERLLKALKEGEKQKERAHSRGRRSRHGMGADMGGTFESFSRAFSNIGPIIKDTMEDVMTGIFADDLGDAEGEDLVDVEPLEDQYTIDDDTSIVIVSDWKWGAKHGDLRVRGVSGNACRIDAEAEIRRIRRSATHFVVHWSGGPLSLEVPETVSRLLVNSKGGDIRIADVHGDISAKTMHGNLILKDLLNSFKVKTMGGDIRLMLSAGWDGEAKVRTMGGNITLAVPDGVGFSADAFTMGGTISVAEGMRLEDKKSFPGKKGEIHAGAEDSDSTISLKTMGGNITLRNEADEDQQ